MKTTLLILFLTAGVLGAQPSPLPRTVPRGIPATPPPANQPAPVTQQPASVPVSLPPGQIAIAPPASAADTSPEDILPAGMIDFRGADVNQVLQLYAELVNRTILRPASLPAPTIVLKTQTPLTKREAIQALDAVLGLNGIAMIDIGDKFVKAVQTQTAGQEGQAFNQLDAGKLPDMGQYVTHVVQLKYAKPSEMVQALTPFAKIPGAILAIDSSQILVLRDFTENVKRMLEMIKAIDVSVPSEYISEVIPIKYALSSDIANALNSLSSGGGGTTVGKSTASGSRSSSGFGRTGTGGSPGATMPGATAPGATAQPGGGSFTDRLQSIIKRASISGEVQVLGQTKIISDERTNSLLIFASREDMKMIKDIVAKLDVVLAQVLIEAVIIEVTLDNSKSLGFSYLEGQPHGIGNFSGQGALNNGTMLSRANFASGAGSNLTSALPGGFSYLGAWGNDLDVTVTALASDSRARILQRPRIQTSHAVPASLFVGQTRPYPTGSYYGGGAYGGYSSIQQMQVGVSLDVTPLINPDGLVVMDIHQKIDSVSGTVNIANVGDVPITSSKEAQAKVAVRDRETVILGGLIETTKSSSASGVPFLKDVPLLGFLFRSSSKDDARDELIVLIRPTVLPTPEVAAQAARAERNRMPEIKRAEAEDQQEEARRLKATDHFLKTNRPSAYQPTDTKFTPLP